MQSFLDVVRREVTRCGIVPIPYLNERLCTSIGCHLMNMSNLKNKRFYYGGALENFRKHLIVMIQSGYGKSGSLNFYLNPDYGLLAGVQEIIPTDIRSTFSPESWLGTIAQSTDDKGNTILKSKGIFNRFKLGILGADEFMRLKLLSENEVSTNEEVYLLSGLESDKATKDLALGEITEQDIGTTIWGGMRYATMRTTSGLLRRFTAHLFYPTPTIAHQFKLANRNASARSGISVACMDSMKAIMEETLDELKDINTIDYTQINKFLDTQNIPHFNETIYRRMAVGYSVATGTFPNIKLDNALTSLIENEQWAREVIRNDPEKEAIYQVVKNEKRPLTLDELKTFFIRYYLMSPHKFNVLFDSLTHSGHLIAQNNKVYSLVK